VLAAGLIRESCKRTSLSLAWASGHPRQRRPRSWSGRERGVLVANPATAPLSRGRGSPGAAAPGQRHERGRRAATRLGLRIPPMSTVTRRALTAWLVDHGFAELGGKATSHRRFRHESGVVITVPGHGRQNLSQKHVGMIVRQLEDAGFDRDTVRRDLNAR